MKVNEYTDSAVLITQLSSSLYHAVQILRTIIPEELNTQKIDEILNLYEALSYVANLHVRRLYGSDE